MMTIHSVSMFLLQSEVVLGHVNVQFEQKRSVSISLSESSQNHFKVDNTFPSCNIPVNGPPIKNMYDTLKLD